MIATQLRLRLLLAAAAAIGIYGLSTSGQGSGAPDLVAARGVAAPARVVTNVTPKARTSSVATAVSPSTSMDLVQRLAHRVGDARNSDFLFAKHSWYVPPPPPPVVKEVAPPPPPPTAPPVPFGVMGSYARPGEVKVYFMTRGERVFDVHVGDTIDGTYKVDAEANGQLLLTYLPLNIHQSIALGDSQ